MDGGNARQGVSPLIAAVLLIAFTMAVAAILTAWVTSFTEQRSQELSNKSEQLIQCSYAGLDVYDAVYDSANSQTDVSVENTGTVDLNNISVTAFVGATVQARTYVSGLASGEVESTTISGTDEKPDKIRAASRDCPSLVSEETSISTS
ncbi:MAG: CARDB domain-containing protein [Candidatus Nanohaloarchaea archaeon]|nr:CARDB domain-containing protein [Candidatus Nanohaloarchaea archaeon]